MWFNLFVKLAGIFVLKRVKLAFLHNREAKQHLNLRPCWARDQYVPVAFPKIAATSFILQFTVWLKMYCPVVGAVVNKQNPRVHAVQSVTCHPMWHLQ